MNDLVAVPSTFDPTGAARRVEKPWGWEIHWTPADRPYGVEAIIRDNSGNWLVLVERPNGG